MSLSQLSVYEARALARRAGERFLFPKKHDAPVRVCLVYPNHYALAMGNLGFQVVHEIFDRFAGVVCERAFLPEDDVVGAQPLRALESGRRVGEFDLIAFSISFEMDYMNVIPLLELAGLAARRDQRDPGAPLLVAGGPAVFLNPEPIAEFFDLFLIGEAEEMLPEFLEVYCARATAERRSLLEAVAERVGGAYVPDYFQPVFDGPILTELRHDGPGRAAVERRLVRDLNQFSTTSRVLTDEAVFGDMVMVEASRGCQWGCRFCAAGFMYRPIRTRDLGALAESVAAGLVERDAVGLIGAEMASVPGVDRLAAQAAAAGGRLSPSSLKADCVTPRLASALAQGGTLSVTVAPEAGSERMRRVINKNLTEADILRAADLLVGEGVQRLKLYFMVGLPTEREEDVVAIAELVEGIRGRLSNGGRVRALTVSVNPFVPKPWTPFQWDPMEPIPSLRGKLHRLDRACGKVPNLQFASESPRAAYLQAVLSRGDRRVARVLEAIHRGGGDWWRVIRQWRQSGIDGLPHPDSYVHRHYDYTERLPWDFIEHHLAKGYLRTERRKAMSVRQTAPCDTSTCTSCAAC